MSAYSRRALDLGAFGHLPPENPCYIPLRECLIYAVVFAYKNDSCYTSFMVNHISKQSLESANNSLKDAIATYEKYKPTSDLSLMRLNEAGIIQNFEFTFELAWKTMAKWLSEFISPDQALSKNAMYRLAAEKGLIDSPEQWLSLQDARNTTSHTYDNFLATTVLSQAISFPPLVDELIKKLQ